MKPEAHHATEIAASSGLEEDCQLAGDLAIYRGGEDKEESKMDYIKRILKGKIESCGAHNFKLQMNL